MLGYTFPCFLRGRNQLNSSRSTVPTAILIAVLVVGTVLSGAVYIRSIRNLLVSDLENSLASTSEQAASSIEAKLDGQVDALNAIASLQSIADPEAPLDDKLEILRAEAERRGFIRLNIAGLDGMSHTSDGKTADISDREYFKKAIAGEPNISDKIISRHGDGEVVAQAAPVYYAGEIVGVVVATQSVSHISDLVAQMTLPHGEDLCIIGADGSIVTHCDGLDVSGDTSFFEAIEPENSASTIAEVKRIASSGASGVAHLTYGGSQRLVGITPIEGTQAWQLFVGTPTKTVMATSNRVLIFSFALLAFALFLTGVVAAYISTLRRRYLTAENEHLKEVQDLAYKDQLTGLPNRLSMKRELLDRFATCRREKTVGAVFLVDINDFQVVNNTFGQAVGDRMLVEVADRLRTLQESEAGEVLVGRFAGDDFLVVLTGAERRSEIATMAADITGLFAEPFSASDGEFRLTASIGVVIHNENLDCAVIDVEELIRHCELSLAQAQLAQTGHYFIFDTDLGKRADDEIQMEHDLRHAIENDEFLLHYQPQFDSRLKKIVGFEALLRWNSPRHGMVPPMTFIPMAEKTGMITDIGRFVVDRTFEFARKVEPLGIRVSCNCSAVELLQADFVGNVLECFQKHGLSRGTVAIEITESSLIGSFERVSKKLHMLRRHGIAIHLDDFGTGFSSLTYLKSLPLDVVKIDKSFTSDVADEAVNRDIIRTIVTLCDHLSLGVIAEGIETRDQLMAVQGCGCDVMQGYCISRPVEEAAAIEMIQHAESLSCQREDASEDKE